MAHRTPEPATAGRRPIRSLLVALAVVASAVAAGLPWEKPRDAVAAAVRKSGILYAVVQDNDFAIWTLYGVRAWPTLVLVDRRGIVRHRHVGGGAYAGTEAVIRRLLAERP